MYKLSLERRGRYNAGLGYAFEGTSSLLSGLEHYWTLNEASGTRADSVGGATLTDNNTVLFSTGIRNNAANFVTANLEFLSSSLTDIPGDFTISLWVNQPSFVATRVLIGKDVTTGRDFQIYVLVTSGRAGFDVFSGASLVSASGAATATTAGSWNHVVAWYTSSDQKAHIVVNGGATVDSAALPGARNNTATTFRVGAREFVGFQQYLTGSLDEIGLWSRVLTPDERATLYNAGAGKFYPEF